MLPRGFREGPQESPGPESQRNRVFHFFTQNRWPWGVAYAGGVSAGANAAPFPDLATTLNRAFCVWGEVKFPKRGLR